MKRVIVPENKKPAIRMPEGFIGNKRMLPYDTKERQTIIRNAKKVSNYLEDEFSSRPGVYAEVDYMSSYSGKTVEYTVYFTSDSNRKLGSFVEFSVKLEDLLKDDDLYRKLRKSVAWKKATNIRNGLLEALQLDQMLHSAEFAKMFQRIYQIPGNVTLESYGNGVQWNHPKYYKAPARAHSYIVISDYWTNSNNIIAEPVAMVFDWEKLDVLSEFSHLTLEELVQRYSAFFDPHAAITNLCTILDELSVQIPEDAVLTVFGLYDSVDFRIGSSTISADWTDLADSPNDVLNAIIAKLL